MPLTFARRIQYLAVNNVKCAHHIHVYHHKGQTILIAADTEAGQSITNSIEILVSTVRNRYGIIPDIIVEHYPDMPRGEDHETFDRVTLRWDAARSLYTDVGWRASTRAEVEALIGEPFSGEEALPEASHWLTERFPPCPDCYATQRLGIGEREYCARCGQLPA